MKSSLPQPDVAATATQPEIPRPHGTPTLPGPIAREPIAIVGVGCRLPGGITDTDGLWKALLEGRDCVVDIPGSRWDPQKFLDTSGRAPGRSYVQKAGMLTEDPRGIRRRILRDPSA